MGNVMVVSYRVVWEIPEREIPGNTIREIRDRLVNTGKYEKKFVKSYIISIKRVYEVKISKLNKPINYNIS